MNLAWPWVLLLLPLPWAYLRLLRKRPVHGLPVTPDLAAAFQSRIDEASVRPHSWHRSRYRLWPLLRHWGPGWLAWSGLLLALAQPQYPGAARVQPALGRALAVVVDLSDSMSRDDFELDGRSASRLSIVRDVVGDFIEQRRGDRLSLVLFGKEAFIAAPLSFDVLGLRDILGSSGIGMAGRSTAIGDALGLALQSLRADPATEKAIVLLSDGTNNAGAVEPEAAAALAGERGVRIHTVALGSERESQGLTMAPSADLDTATLEAIASASGGRYFRATSSHELQTVYDEIDSLERAETQAPPLRVWHDLRWFGLGLMLLACSLSLWRTGYRTLGRARGRTEGFG